MRAVPFVFSADVFPDIAVRDQIQGVRDAEGLGIHFGIIQPDVHIHVADIPPLVPFLNRQGFTVRMTRTVQPAFIVEPDSIDYEGIAIPLAN